MDPLLFKGWDLIIQLSDYYVYVRGCIYSIHKMEFLSLLLTHFIIIYLINTCLNKSCNLFMQSDIRNIEYTQR